MTESHQKPHISIQVVKPRQENKDLSTTGNFLIRHNHATEYVKDKCFKVIHTLACTVEMGVNVIYLSTSLKSNV